MQVSSKDLKNAWDETDHHLKKSLEIAIKESKSFMKKKFLNHLLLKENMVNQSKGDGCL